MPTTNRFVYILKSVMDPQRHYVGSTADVSARLGFHNAGLSSHTAKYRPWELVVALGVRDGSDRAAFREISQIRLWPRIRQTELRLTSFEVDSPSKSPYVGLMELHVPRELEAKLNRLVADTGRDAEQRAIDLLASSIKHDEWFRREVERGRISAREGRLLDCDELLTRIEQRYRA